MGCSTSTSLSGGYLTWRASGFLGAVLSLRGPGHILGLPATGLLDVALPWISASTGGGATELGWVSLHLSPDSRDASSGDWDTESCQTLETQAAHTRCQCQHLSTFAVLAQPPKDLVSGREVPGLGGRGLSPVARSHLWRCLRGPG